MLNEVNIAILSLFLGFHCLTKLIVCLNHEVVFKSLLCMILQSLNHIQLRLFMLNQVNIAILSPFLGLHCPTNLIICLNHEVVFISLLCMILQSLNHIQLPLFMLNEVNIALLLWFLGFHCLTKLIICLNHDVVFISLICAIHQSLIHIQLLLFMLNEVSIALLSPFLGFHCLTKLIIYLNHEFIFISLLFMSLQSLNNIQVLLFMMNKVNVNCLRLFLGF